MWMATRSEFVAEAQDLYLNHGVYIGTGNGELVESLTIKDIHKMELNYGDNPPRSTRRVLAHIGQCYENGYDMTKARAGDCSGIIVYILRKLAVIKPTADYSAKMFQSMAEAVSLKSLQPADLVFNKTTNSSHVGIYVGDGMVIESKGRDDGVVYRKLSAGPWVVGGRFSWWDDDGIKFYRNLKYVKGKIMVGSDVETLQKALRDLGYYTGEIDAEYGPASEAAVRVYQSDYGLAADGIAGKNTITSLGFTWSD